MIVAVYNRGHNTVEAAGRVFPPRRQTIVDVDDERSDEIHRHPRLDVRQVDYDQLTVDQLKDELRARDLKVSGSKGELVARLTEATSDNEGDDDGGD